ncbi:glutathione S-transferase family protein [Solimonas sp. K1W22B-7]|uniref:glutathione S-transferase family protein n=1 Tax=Solimonas sp. K1W22B-7 TaxID=2303331 RepID=UPI000E3323A3|nr:glutathione S-transferase family protein [Solimonas sp. K1W22B-7]AXQ27724.1 glutathione S-transferase family protein [Solimonas sp. K1W22B-7]
MVQLISSDAAVAGMRGLHLFHHGMSSCSQRVRIVLEEKQAGWHSHIVDLAKDENVTPEYLAINPKGLVPALVHDGIVHIESMDIIAYLNRELPGPDLGSGDPGLQEWISRCDSIQPAIKTASFEFLFKPKQKKSERQLAHYERLAASNPGLLAFHRAFSTAEGLHRSKISGAVEELVTAVSTLDAHLNGREWMVGDRFGMADVVWMVNAHRLALMGFPVESFASYADWSRRVAQRDSYRQGLVRWEPAVLRYFWRLYTRYRHSSGSGFRSYM